jgi:hypothetical protein
MDRLTEGQLIELTEVLARGMSLDEALAEADSNYQHFTYWFMMSDEEDSTEQCLFRILREQHLISDTEMPMRGV